LFFFAVGEYAAVCDVKGYHYFSVYLVDILSTRRSTSGILKREFIVRYLNHRYLIINNRCSIIKLKNFPLGILLKQLSKQAFRRELQDEDCMF
jgi:hypothetical protein